MIIKKYKIKPDDFKIIETVILKTEPHKAGHQWKFTGAFYYGNCRSHAPIKKQSNLTCSICIHAVLTVLTTIGYGHSTPSTVGGKLFTMFYAMVGIPLGEETFDRWTCHLNFLCCLLVLAGLVMFQSIGERVNRLSRWVEKAFGASWRGCCSSLAQFYCLRHGD